MKRPSERLRALLVLGLCLLLSGSWAGRADPPPTRRVAQAGSGGAVDASSRLERLATQAAAIAALPFSPVFLLPATATTAMDGRDADAVFRFVRQHITYQPYRGRVRGARGALLSRAGNSVDIALLMGALLEQRGLSWRLAHGPLDDEQAVMLLRATLPSAELRGAEARGASSPSSAGWLRRTAADHWWVEANIGADWRPLDPVYPGLEAGQSVVEPNERHEPGALPGRLANNVSLRVAYRRGMRTPQTALEFSSDLVDLSYRNVVLTFESSARTLSPSLEVAGSIVRGDTMQRTDAEQIWLELEFGTGAQAYRMQRELRRADGGLDLFEGSVQVFSILFVPGWVGPDYYTAVTGSVTGELVGDLTRFVNERGDAPAGRLSTGEQNDLAGILGPMTGLIGISHANASDEMVLGLAAQTGLRPTFRRPRIIIAGAAQLGNGFTFRLDLRQDIVESVVLEGVPAGIEQGFQVLRGRLNSAVAASVVANLTGLPTLAPDELLASAWQQGGPPLTIGATSGRGAPRPRTDGPIRERYEADMAGGGIVIVPREPIAVGDGERMAWWRIESASGYVIGVLDDGTRGAVASGGAAATSLSASLLDVAESLLAGLTDQLTHGRNLRDRACVVACDAQRIADVACGDPSEASLARCLSGRPTSDDPLGLGLACEEMIVPYRCGAIIGRALVDGSLTVAAGPEAAFWGPWDEAREGLSARGRCQCEE